MEESELGPSANEDHDMLFLENILSKRRGLQTRKALIISSVIALVVGLAIGLLIGRFGTCPDEQTTESSNAKGVFLPGVSERIVQDADMSVSQEIIDAIKSENIKEYLRHLSMYPHLAGTDADYEQAKGLEEFWKQEGLDDAFITPYDVLLSYPNTTEDSVMNRIELISSSGDILYTSPLREAILRPEDVVDNKSRDSIVPPFNAYSAPGNVTSESLVYVNYGRVEDYRKLQEIAPDVSVNDSVVIVRYGKIFRGDKVNIAAEHGAKAVIIFSDPADYTLDGNTVNVYPKDWFLPGSGAQRGTVFLGGGDPLTPGYPAIETAYRLKEDSKEANLPKIPAHPIGYDIAWAILREMNGAEVPTEWKGKLNITYRIGGVLPSSLTIRVFISTRNARRTTYNVFGIIRGAVEPDRYVLLGNHRDAWVFGAIDPSSGTATMKEVSRVMGNMVKSGRWRPRRSIVFCSWGSEEYGLIGSNEWIEQYVKNLVSRSVAYLNVDIAVQGNYSMRALGTPMMYKSVYQAVKKIKNPDKADANNPTLYDKWLEAFPNSEKERKPTIGSMGSGSDYARFITYVGLPCTDIRYTYNSNNLTLASYPLYHSVYETFFSLDQIMDKGFLRHRAIGQAWAELARDLSDSLIIPFDVRDFSANLIHLVDTLENDYGALLKNNNVNFDWLRNAANSFEMEAKLFMDKVNDYKGKDPFVIRKINDQLMLMERAFLDPEGIPGRPLIRHILFASSSVDSYAGSSFPGLVDSLFEIESAPDKEQRWEIVRRHFSVIIFTIGSAESTLRDVTKFMPVFKRN